MRSKLYEILEEIETEKKKYESFDNPELENIASRNSVALRAAKLKNIKNNIEDLKKEYKKLALDMAVFVVVHGEFKNDFLNIAKEDFGCYVYNSNTVFKDIVDEMDSSFYNNKTSSANFVDVLQNIFEADIASRTEVMSYNPIRFDAKYKRNLSSSEDAVKLVMEMIADTIGLEISLIDSVVETSQIALMEKFEGRGGIFPVLIDSDPDFTQRILSDISIKRKIVNLEITEYPTEESVKDTLLSIRNDEPVKTTAKKAKTAKKANKE